MYLFRQDKLRDMGLDITPNTTTFLQLYNTLESLLIHAVLAHIWIACLGDLADNAAWRVLFDRKDRPDLSLFQLGLHLLAHLLNHDLAGLVSFQFNLPVLQALVKCAGK